MRRQFIAEEFQNVFIQNQYHTHTHPWAEWLHRIGENILRPPHYFMFHLLARVIQPNPGANKDQPLRGELIRLGIVSCLLGISLELLQASAIYLGILSYPILSLGILQSPYFKIASSIIGLVMPLAGYSLRAITHRWRPATCYLVSDKVGANMPLLEMSKKKPLELAAYNLALTPKSISTVGDMRDPVERAREFVDAITNLPERPDMIFFQEADLCNEDALRILVEGLSPIYPYIMHNVGKNTFSFFEKMMAVITNLRNPSIAFGNLMEALGVLGGFGGSVMVASRFPVKLEGFYPFKNMEPSQKPAPRGVLVVSIQTEQSRVVFLNTHTQSLSGEERTRIRDAQIEYIHNIAIDPGITNGDPVVVVGDLNTARMTEAGEINVDLNNPEIKVLKFLEERNKELRSSGKPEIPLKHNPPEVAALNCLAKRFEDPFLNDHHIITGERTEGESRFSQKGHEPTGTWYHDPFPVLDFFRRLLSLLSNSESSSNYHPPAWGTRQWDENRSVTTSRYDLFLFPRTFGYQALGGRVEIRHLPSKGKQSSVSDHLLVQAQIFRK